MNEAVQLLTAQFGFGEGGGPRDVFMKAAGDGSSPFANVHPEAMFSLFGPSGTKELIQGRDAFIGFVTRCAGALAGRQDEILAITPIDEQCALVHARAWRKAKASGEEIDYEWAMLYRVEAKQITYGTDILDSDAQAFWGRILGH